MSDKNAYPQFVRKLFNNDDTARFEHKLEQTHHSNIQASDWNAIIAHWQTHGFDVYIWVVVDFNLGNAYDPFIKLRVAPTDDERWINTDIGKIIVEIRNGNYHISIGKLSSLLHSLRPLEQMYDRYKFPRVFHIKPEDFKVAFHSGTITFNPSCQICKDWHSIWALGSEGYKSGLHFVSAMNAEKKRYTLSEGYVERREPPD